MEIISKKISDIIQLMYWSKAVIFAGFIAPIVNFFTFHIKALFDSPIGIPLPLPLFLPLLAISVIVAAVFSLFGGAVAKLLFDRPEHPIEGEYVGIVCGFLVGLSVGLIYSPLFG